jgi:hypothetical protein
MRKQRIIIEAPCLKVSIRGVISCVFIKTFSVDDIDISFVPTDTLTSSFQDEITK